MMSQKIIWNNFPRSRRFVLDFVALEDTFAIMNLDVKTGPATDLLLKLSIIQPCQQKDQILLPCLFYDKLSIYFYHFPLRRADSPHE